jgi:hypothetical protein
LVTAAGSYNPFTDYGWLGLKGGAPKPGAWQISLLDTVFFE